MSGSFAISGVFRVCRFVLGGVALMGAMSAFGVEEDFINYLNEEAARVDTPAAEISAGVGKSAPVAGEEREAARRAFESGLERKNRGTWMFYRKLPRRYRDEIFEDHLRGASLEEVRAKIIRRYLHER